MYIYRIVLIILWFILPTTSNAAAWGLSAHSRANCINNESISWDGTRSWLLATESQHLDLRTGVMLHNIWTGWQDTRRSAAVHYGEGRGGWAVKGIHWINDGGHPRIFKITYTTDCDIYDGWWNANV